MGPPSHPNRNPGGYWIHPRRWVADVTAGKPFDRHPQVAVVRYEDLVSDFARTLNGICRFLGIEAVTQLANWQHHTTVA